MMLNYKHRKPHLLSAQAEKNYTNKETYIDRRKNNIDNKEAYTSLASFDRNGEIEAATV